MLRIYGQGLEGLCLLRIWSLGFSQVGFGVRVLRARC